MKIVPILVTLLLVLLMSCVSDENTELSGNDNAENAAHNVMGEGYLRLQMLPSDTLIKLGDDYSRLHAKPDSAIIAYTLVTKRYRPDMPLADKRRVIDAYKGLWFNFFYHYYDYASANEALRKAIELSEDCGEPMGRPYLNMGIFYSEMSEVTGEKSLGEEGAYYQKLAFKRAADEKDYEVMVSAVDNLLCNSATMGDTVMASEEMRNLRKMAADPKTGLSEMWRYKYVALLDEGFRAIVRKDYNLALDWFSRQFDVFPPISNSMARYYIYTHFKSGDLLKKLGQLGKAEEQFRQAYDLSLDYGVKDYRLLICDALSGLYAQTGRQDKSLEFRTLYLNLKDSLLSYRQLASAKEMSVYMDMKEIDREISSMRRKNDFQRNLIALIAGVALVVTGILIFNYIKNRKIKRLNHTLYEKNVELLNADSLRHTDEVPNDDAAGSGIQATCGNEEEVCPGDSRYKNSALCVTQKEDIMRKIFDVMDSEEIYQAGFSLETLARLTGENYKYISQVINESRGCNFNIFLNEYRIKRACRMINSPDSGAFTIEWLANQVGFKSRNTFTVAFKKVTGLNPSEYIKIARSGDKQRQK